MLRCPSCKTQLLNDADLAGQLVQCPTCSKHLRMPQLPPQPVKARVVPQSGMGIASFVIAVVCLSVTAILFLLGLAATIYRGYAPAIYFGVLARWYMVQLIPCAVGFGLAIAARRQRNRLQKYTGFGFIGNFVLLAIFAALMVFWVATEGL